MIYLTTAELELIVKALCNAEDDSHRRGIDALSQAFGTIAYKMEQCIENEEKQISLEI